MRKLAALTFGIMSAATISSASEADSPLVFVSSFAGGDDGAIHAFKLDLKSGALTRAATTSDTEFPFFMALPPDNKRLYAIHTESFGNEVNNVAAYSLKGRSGELKRLNLQSTRGKASCYLDVDSTGGAVFVANYLTGDVGSYPVKADGSLGAMKSFHRHQGSSVDPKRQKAPFAHSIVVSPDNRLAYAADLGIDKVMIYRVDAKSGALRPNEPAFAALPPGSGPRHLTFHPKAEFVYVINELANTLSAFKHAPETGALTDIQNISTLPKDFEGVSHTADVKITPDGRFLYGTNRGHDSIAAYAIGKDGRLTLIEIAPSLGKGPQNLAIAPDGRHLFCANMPGNNLAAFRVGKDGRLRQVGKPIEIKSPSCIMIAE
jgi:6-phosphogluconolactonase